MTTLLYGHDGQPLLVGGTNGGATRVDRARVDQAWQTEVAKRVRQRAITMGLTDRMRGRPKPTPVSFDTLRLMYQRNEWVAAVVKTRQQQVRGVKWDVVLKDGDDPSGAAAKQAKAMKKLLERPCMHGSAPTSLSWRQWIGMFLEDLLVLDAAAWEKERDGNGWIVAIYPVDGATIRPNIDERGRYHTDAYVQLVEGRVEARYSMTDLVYAMDNPQTDVRFFGYGYSPLEKLIVSVTADLHAARYNSDYFQKGAVPEGLMHLGEDAAPEDVDAFRMYWQAEIQGKPWNLPIIGGTKAPEWIAWRESNKDMQFMEYQDWLLQRICAVYQISKSELGAIEDVNRSTAESQDDQTEQKSCTPLLELITDTINLEIIGEHGQGLGDYLEFKFDQPGDSAEAINNKFAVPVAAGAATRQEWRDALSLGDAEKGAVGAEGLTMHLSDGTPQPLPAHQDAMVMGAAATQDREDQQAKEQQAHEQTMGAQDGQGGQDGGEPAALPWQRADPNDPDVKSAMADHDERSGIGPRNAVGKRAIRDSRIAKTHPLGHDRHPTLTDREDALGDDFTRALTTLTEGLATILGGSE